MNEKEFELLRAQMRIVALEAALDWVADILRIKFALSAPHELERTRSAFLAKLSRAKQEYTTITLPWLPPEMSDLQAGEFQEAFDDVAKMLERKIFGSSP